MQCSLCGSLSLRLISHQFVKNRRFFHCQDCDLIFVPEQDQSSIEQEKNRYLDHQNSTQDDGYEKFLMQVVQPILDVTPEKVRASLQVLDYGCGQFASLSKILNKNGFRTKYFDPYFLNDTDIFKQKWDLVFSTEVWEHFRNPRIEIEKIFQLLNSSGRIAIITQLHHVENFYNWWYPRDFTHVAFYSEKTIQYISRIFNLDFKVVNRSVILLKTKDLK